MCACARVRTLNSAEVKEGRSQFCYEETFFIIVSYTNHTLEYLGKNGLSRPVTSDDDDDDRSTVLKSKRDEASFVTVDGRNLAPVLT